MILRMEPFAKWPAYLMIAAVLAASVALALVFWLTPMPEPDRGGVSILAKPAAEVKSTPKVTTPTKTRVVHVYPARLKVDLNLPAEVQANPDQFVISTATVAADEYPHTVTTTFDVQSGEAQSYVRPDPLPALAINTRGEAGISYGYKNGQLNGRLQIRQDLIQIKAVRLGAAATLDQDGEWFAGLGAFYRW